MSRPCSPNPLSLRLSVLASLREKKGASGFTLIELVLVLLIISVVMAITAPSLSHFINGRKTSNAANDLIALARHGRSKAISEGRSYRLTVDTTQKKFWLEAQEGANFSELGTDLGQHHAFPDGTTVQWKDAPNAAVNAPANTSTNVPTNAQANPLAKNAANAPANQSIIFYPDGRSDAATLTVTGSAGDEIELGALAESEPWHVIKDGE